MNKCKRCKHEFNEPLDNYRVYVQKGERLEFVASGLHCSACVRKLKINQYIMKKGINEKRCMLCEKIASGQIINHAFYCDDCKELL